MNLPMKYDSFRSSKIYEVFRNANFSTKIFVTGSFQNFFCPLLQPLSACEHLWYVKSQKLKLYHL